MKAITLVTAIALVGAVACDNTPVGPEPLPVAALFGGGIGDPPVSNVSMQIILPPGVDPNNPVVTVNALVAFLARITGGAGSITIEWDFGDGTIIIDGPVLAHVYTVAGIYTVTVVVIDRDPATGEILGSASDALTLAVIGDEPSLEELISDLIQAVDDVTFTKPQRAKAMRNKLNALQDLVANLEYDEALSKLTDDISPKLTLANKHSWITSGDLSAELAAVVNALAGFGATHLASVEIDIQPGTDPNTITLGSSEAIPVAILSGPDFDATSADPATVVLADVPAGQAGLFPSTEDVNGDGLPDLMVYIAASSLDFLAVGETEAVLTGETVDGTAFGAMNVIRVVE